MTKLDAVTSVDTQVWGQLLIQGEYLRVLAMAEQRMAEAPSPLVEALLCTALVRLRRYADAEARLKALLATDDKDALSLALDAASEMHRLQRRMPRAEDENRRHVQLRRAMHDAAIPETSIQLARALNQRAEIFKMMGRKAEIAALAQESLSLTQPSHEPMAVYERARALCRIADDHAESGAYAKAEAVYLEAESLFSTLQPTDALNFRHMRCFVRVLRANVYRAMGRMSESLAILDELIPIYAELAQLNPETYRSDYSALYVISAHTLYMMKRLGESRERSLRAIAMIRELYARDPESQLRSLATAYNNLAVTCNALRDRKGEAEAIALAAKLRRQQMVNAEQESDGFGGAGAQSDADMREQATTLNNLAIQNASAGRFKKAIHLQLSVLALRRKMALKDPEAVADVAEALNNLATMHSRTLQREVAVIELEEAVRLRRHMSAQNPQKHLPKLAFTLGNLAALMGNRHKTAQAFALYEEAETILSKLVDEGRDEQRQELARTMINHIIVLRRGFQWRRAAELSAQAEEVLYPLWLSAPDGCRLQYAQLMLLRVGVLRGELNFLAAKICADAALTAARHQPADAALEKRALRAQKRLRAEMRLPFVMQRFYVAATGFWGF